MNVVDSSGWLEYFAGGPTCRTWPVATDKTATEMNLARTATVLRTDHSLIKRPDSGAFKDKSQPISASRQGHPNPDLAVS